MTEKRHQSSSLFVNFRVPFSHSDLSFRTIFSDGAPLSFTPHNTSAMAPVEKLATEATDASQGLVSRAQRFIEENQKAILIGCGVAAAAGAGYYLYTQRGSGSGGPSSGSSGSAPASGSSKNKKKKKSKKSGKFIDGEGADGPLLEEIKPKPTEEKAAAKVSDDPLDGE